MPVVCKPSQAVLCCLQRRAVTHIGLYLHGTSSPPPRYRSLIGLIVNCTCPILPPALQVQKAIKKGGFWRQLTAVVLLRLTPVVPFSASNYVLGLTPLELPAFVGGTVAGMGVWSVLYASLGGASRSLVDNGMDVGELMAGGRADPTLQSGIC